MGQPVRVQYLECKADASSRFQHEAHLTLLKRHWNLSAWSNTGFHWMQGASVHLKSWQIEAWIRLLSLVA